jgi:pilus assembly protein FimV
MKAVRLVIQFGLAALLMATVSTVQALGLGNLELDSQLNQRLSANIPVFVPEEIDPSDINVRLAENSHFERAGIKRSDLVNQLTFSPKRTADGKMIISVSSRKRMVEPMLSFVLEVVQDEFRTVKQYTVMLPAPTR